MSQLILDQWGMILQHGDGGDSAANMGTYHIFLETRRRMGHVLFPDGPWPNKEYIYFDSALSSLEDRNCRLGLYRRHPDHTKWYSRVNTMSRDQTIPLLGAMALYGMKVRMFEYILGHALRGFLFTTNTTPNWSDPNENPRSLTLWEKIKFFFGSQSLGKGVYAFKIPDITIGDFWALEIRGIYSPWLWAIFFPLLCVLDLFTVVGSLDKVFVYGKNSSNSDDRNQINILLVGLQICPTPTIKFAAWVYSKRPRAKLPPGFVVGPGYPLPSGPQSALDDYYGSSDSPPFNVLARPIVLNYFEARK